MNVAYYPGCSLHGTAKEYGASTEDVAKTLGIDMDELEDWNCCGASSAHMTNDDLAFSLAARNLDIMDKTGLDLVVPCAACFQRLKRAEKRLLAKEKPEGVSVTFSGDHQIKWAPDFFWKDVGEKAIEAKIKKTLTGLKAVCYYGCLTSRPPEITDAEHPENPVALDKLMKLLGADVHDWSFKTDCCGGNLTLTKPDISGKMTGKLADMAREAGAECIIAACPLCQSNLDMGQPADRPRLPVFYFTELLGLAFGDPVEKWLGGHIVDPRPLLREKNLL
jgi:heterodisulfide reductase subunit B